MYKRMTHGETRRSQQPVVALRERLKCKLITFTSVYVSLSARCIVSISD
jgi:hypothetical protein